MQSLDLTLLERVDEVLATHKSCELHSTTGLQATVGELALRSQGLERALHEIALDVQKLAESIKS